jgi:hypothetical protein
VYDGLTGRYTFRCPAAGEARVRLSRFRSLDRLEGPSHPAVYRVRFACPCGEEHEGLVSHDELDWAPLGAAADEFLNLMTGRLEPAADELLALAAARIGAGEWPWSFFCYPEGRPRPVFPSAFRLLAAAEARVGVAVRCPDCGGTSVNVVTHRHVDEPFFNDPDVGVVEHVFRADADALVGAFRAELDSGSFDARRLSL